MKKILLIGLLLASLATSAQTYTYIAQRNEWLAGMFRAFNLPAGPGPAAFQSGQIVRAGALYYDSSGVDAGLYVWDGAAWVVSGGGGGAAVWGGITGSLPSQIDLWDSLKTRVDNSRNQTALAGTKSWTAKHTFTIGATSGVAMELNTGGFGSTKFIEFKNSGSATGEILRHSSGGLTISTTAGGAAEMNITNNGSAGIRVNSSHASGLIEFMTNTIRRGIFNSSGLTLGQSGTAVGLLNLAGATSGTVSLRGQPAAGTWTLQLPNALPAADGYVLKSSTAGVSYWDVDGGGTPVNIYTADGALPTSANRFINLDLGSTQWYNGRFGIGYRLPEDLFEVTNEDAVPLIVAHTTAGEQYTAIGAANTTADGWGQFFTQSTDDHTEVNMYATYGTTPDPQYTVDIVGYVDADTSYVTYQAGQHIFAGPVRVDVLSGGSGGVVVADGVGNISVAPAGSADVPASLIIPVGDELTSISTGTAKRTFRIPYDMAITEVFASLSTASSSGLPTIDIKRNGTTILSTLITLDATEKISTTAVTPPVISTSTLTKYEEITIDITVAGTGAKGLVIYLNGTR